MSCCCVHALYNTQNYHEKWSGKAWSHACPVLTLSDPERTVVRFRTLENRYILGEEDGGEWSRGGSGEDGGGQGFKEAVRWRRVSWQWRRKIAVLYRYHVEQNMHLMHQGCFESIRCLYSGEIRLYLMRTFVFLYERLWSENCCTRETSFALSSASRWLNTCG